MSGSMLMDTYPLRQRPFCGSLLTPTSAGAATSVPFEELPFSPIIVSEWELKAQPQTTAEAREASKESLQCQTPIRSTRSLFTEAEMATFCQMRNEEILNTFTNLQWRFGVRYCLVMILVKLLPIWLLLNWSGRSFGDLVISLVTLSKSVGLIFKVLLSFSVDAALRARDVFKLRGGLSVFLRVGKVLFVRASW